MRGRAAEGDGIGGAKNRATPPRIALQEKERPARTRRTLDLDLAFLGRPAAQAAGLMFWLARNRLSGSYFALMAASLS